MRDEKFTTGRGLMLSSPQSDKIRTDKEWSVFIACGQLDALFRSTQLMSRTSRTERGDPVKVLGIQRNASNIKIL